VFPAEFDWVIEQDAPSPVVYMQVGLFLRAAAAT